MKLQQEGKTLNEVINIKDKAGMSLLEKSLAARKFDMAKYLLLNGATVNNVSREGYNEFHFIASNINSDGAIEIARRDNAQMLEQCQRHEVEYILVDEEYRIDIEL